MVKTIGLDKLRKDNSNLWRIEGVGRTLMEELKKVKFKKVKPNHIDDLRNWVAVTGYGETNPYTELDKKLDLEKFADSLPEEYQEIFNLFLENLTVPEISVELGIPKPTLYSKLRFINQLYKEFYLEE